MQLFNRVSVQGDTISARSYHRTIVFCGRLFVVMGYDTTRLGDMYYSSDAHRWTRVANLRCTDGTNISARNSFGLCEHGGKVYLAGGRYDVNGRLNDVYVSDDMFTWKKLPNAPWSGRHDFVMVSFNGKIWFIGGNITGSPNYMNDVWSSPDGVNWTQHANAPWEARGYFTGCVYNNRVFINSGYGSISNRLGDIWSTKDFIEWKLMSDGVIEQSMINAICNYGNNDTVDTRLIISGGSTAAYVNTNKVWHSQNGKQWYDGGDLGQAVYGHSMDYFNKRLIVIGGNDGSGDGGIFLNDVWEANCELLGQK